MTTDESNNKCKICGSETKESSVESEKEWDDYHEQWVSYFRSFDECQNPECGFVYEHPQPIEM